jgi:hypothetical protein
LAEILNFVGAKFKLFSENLNFGAKNYFFLNFFFTFPMNISSEMYSENSKFLEAKFEIFGKILNLFWRKFEILAKFQIFRAKIFNLNNYLMNFFLILYTFYFENISFFIFFNSIYISHEQFLGNVSAKTCLSDMHFPRRFPHKWADTRWHAFPTTFLGNVLTIAALFPMNLFLGNVVGNVTFPTNSGPFPTNFGHEKYTSFL